MPIVPSRQRERRATIRTAGEYKSSHKVDQPLILVDNITQMEAERNRRKQLLDTQAAINVAEGLKQRTILNSEGELQAKINSVSNPPPL